MKMKLEYAFYFDIAAGAKSDSFRPIFFDVVVMAVVWNSRYIFARFPFSLSVCLPLPATFLSLCTLFTEHNINIFSVVSQPVNGKAREYSTKKRHIIFASSSRHASSKQASTIDKSEKTAYWIFRKKNCHVSHGNSMSVAIAKKEELFQSNPKSVFMHTHTTYTQYGRHHSYNIHLDCLRQQAQ